MAAESIQALRVELFQPSANYRLPYAYQRRLTYPLPPYSAVLGMLRNLLGDHSILQMELKEGLLPLHGIAVAGRFRSKASEYTWLRSLSSDAHKGAFGTFPPLKEPKLDIEYGAVSAGSLFPSEGRYRAYGLPEHPGGQIPVVTDTLQEVELLIYLQAEERVLEKLRQALLEPTPREIPHLGRAEDMIILEEVGTVPLERKEVPPGRYPYSFWVPYTEAKQLDMEGLIYRISLKGEDTLTGRRVTSTEVILWEGEAPYRLPVYWDGEKKLPVFLHLL